MTIGELDGALRRLFLSVVECVLEDRLPQAQAERLDRSGWLEFLRQFKDRRTAVSAEARGGGRDEG